MTPTALETTQFLQQQPFGDMPAVLIVVDPLDDDGRGCYLTRLLLSFRGLERIALTDRLESLFWPSLNEAGDGVAVLDETGEVPVDVGVAGVVRGDRQVGAAERTPLLGVTAPPVGVTTGELGLGVDREVVHRQAEFAATAADRVDAGGRLVVR